MPSVSPGAVRVPLWVIYARHGESLPTIFPRELSRNIHTGRPGVGRRTAQRSRGERIDNTLGVRAPSGLLKVSAPFRHMLATFRGFTLI